MGRIISLAVFGATAALLGLIVIKKIKSKISDDEYCECCCEGSEISDDSQENNESNGGETDNEEVSVPADEAAKTDT